MGVFTENSLTKYGALRACKFVKFYNFRICVKKSKKIIEKSIDLLYNIYVVFILAGCCQTMALGK